jgi:hypothetical protein
VTVLTAVTTGLPKKKELTTLMQTTVIHDAQGDGILLGVADTHRRSVAPLTRSCKNTRDSAEGDEWFTNVHVGRLNLLDGQHTKSAPTLNPSC